MSPQLLLVAVKARIIRMPQSMSSYCSLEVSIHSSSVELFYSVCEGTFDRQTLRQLIATELQFPAIAVVCSKHSPSTKQPLAQLRCVRLLNIDQYLKKKKSCVSDSDTQRTAGPHSFISHTAIQKTTDHLSVVQNDIAFNEWQCQCETSLDKSNERSPML
jgi:hypothetical protein